MSECGETKNRVLFNRRMSKISVLRRGKCRIVVFLVVKSIQTNLKDTARNNNNKKNNNNDFALKGLPDSLKKNV